MKNGEKEVLLEVTDLKQYFPIKKSFQRTQYVKAVDNVSLKVYKGETLGIAGESGCGKSTLIRTCLRLLKPTSGSVVFDGKDISNLSNRRLRPIRRDMQIVFQDPYSSLDSKYKVRSIIEEPMVINHMYGSRKERHAKAEELISAVGMSPEVLDRYPHEFSGGQRQRITIAGALATNPKLLMLDEAVSALDVSVRAQVLNLFAKLKKQYGLTYMFVSHDMSVIEHICDRVVIMYLGKIMEMGTKREIFDNPLHPYTRALLSAVPSASEDVSIEKRIILQGRVPSPLNPPTGCVFHTRCPYTTEKCKGIKPALRDENGHLVACHYTVEELTK